MTDGARGPTIAFGHVGRAVEGHVLDEVRPALFVVALGQRPLVDPHLHHALTLLRGVGAHDVAHAVVEHAEAIGRVDREVGPGERPRIGWRGGLRRRLRVDGAERKRKGEEQGGRPAAEQHRALV